jgi:hypothetical protein
VEFPTPDFYLYIDEFQNMADAARFDEMFSQSRNGRLALTCLHQYQGQLSEEVRRALFGNVGTLIAFQVGADDAQHLERAFDGHFKAHELTGLQRYEVAMKVPPPVGKERTGLPFRAVTLPPMAEPSGYREAIIEESRRRFARPRVKAERAIAHFLASEAQKGEQQRRAAIERTMKQKPALAADSPAARFSRMVDELKAKPTD